MQLEILGRMVNGGLKSVPYNELYLRVGGIGKGAASAIHRTFSGGIGLPIALFVRSAAYGDLIALMRTKQRMSSILGKAHMSSVPLFYISPDHGMHILTDNLQVKLLHIMTNSLNPFQNPTLQHKTMVHNTSESHLQQKIQELFDLDDDNIRQILTPEGRFTLFHHNIVMTLHEKMSDQMLSSSKNVLAWLVDSERLMIVLHIY